MVRYLYDVKQTYLKRICFYFQDETYGVSKTTKKGCFLYVIKIYYIKIYFGSKACAFMRKPSHSVYERPPLCGAYVFIGEAVFKYQHRYTKLIFYFSFFHWNYINIARTLEGIL